MKKLETLFEEFTDYTRYSLRRRERTIESYENSFKLLIKLLPEIQYPNDLSMEKMNEFFKTLQVRERVVGKGRIVTGVKDTTISTYWGKLETFFKWLVVKDYIKESPLKNIPRPNEIYDNAPALRKKYVEKIYTAIVLNNKNPMLIARDTLMVSLLFYLGIRKTELLSIRVIDVDMEKKFITIQGKTSKSKVTRRLGLPPKLLIHLKNYLKLRKAYKTEMLLVSGNRDAGLTDHGIKHWVKKYNKASGVKFHLHQFRHTFACNLVKNGASSVAVQKMLGHTDLRMTDRYLRSLEGGEFRDLINAISLENCY